MDNPKYLWIQTRDGSPTLWSNELGESFRSVKGAFVESWAAFVGPALTFVQKHISQAPVIIGEFGLGPGTNWVLSATAARKLGLALEYSVIEKDLESFTMGCERWAQEFGRINEFVDSQLAAMGLSVTGQVSFSDLPQPRVFATLAEALATPFAAHVWFHDPFGFDVNPDGYSSATLQDCAKLWQPIFWGGSYACNRHFKQALETLSNVKTETVLTGSPLLKRERLEFYRL